MASIDEREKFVRFVFGEIDDGLSFMETFESDQERYEENFDTVESISFEEAMSDRGKLLELVDVLDDLTSFMETCTDYDEETYIRWKRKSNLLSHTSKFT